MQTTKKPFYTVKEVAEKLGIFEPGVRRLIRIGKLKADKINGGYIVQADELDKILKDRGLQNETI